MARHLIARKKFDVTLWNRSKDKALPFQGSAHIADTPQEAITRSDILITMLWDFKSVKETLGLGSEHASLVKGKTVIQMSTISPPENKQLHDLVVEAGGSFIECPVLGTSTVAEAGKLSILVGTTPERFAEVQDLLSSFGPTVRHIGDVGKASAMKLAFNQLVGGQVAIFSASLAMVERQGLPVDTFMEILRPAAMYSKYFDLKLQNMLDRDFSNVLFTTASAEKDFGLIVSECEKLGINPATPAATLEILRKGCERNPDLDFASVYDIVNPPK